MKNFISSLAVLVVAVVFVAGCVQQSGTQQSATGKLVLEITDAPAGLDIEKAEVTISNVEVHLASEDTTNESNTPVSGWHTIVNGTKTFDLIKLMNVKEVLGSADLEPGKYTQIRLTVETAVAVINGNEYTLTIPSKTVKLVHEFDIVKNETTTLTIDFNAQESIHSTGADEYVMRPTIKVISGSEKEQTSVNKTPG